MRELVLMILVPLLMLAPVGTAVASIEAARERREQRQEERWERYEARQRRIEVDTRAWRLPPPPKPKPKPVARQQSQAISNGSSNRYANPSCEARHSQQWSSSGKYWGKYQFDRQTWIAHGGSAGAYGNASEAEQDRIAANVKYDAWPNC